ncbi:hypothetical protein E2C01_060535 [Portunus trituberculatus]|uniref:Uncharacterized protein n=1 Tax=Portunus trituberculatus TaxID=210409 RepID=A0A5B7HBP5_PORTR|nr:hypothetical protein [Portunus trituberculatus]
MWCAAQGWCERDMCSPECIAGGGGGRLEGRVCFFESSFVTVFIFPCLVRDRERNAYPGQRCEGSGHQPHSRPHLGNGVHLDREVCLEDVDSGKHRTFPPLACTELCLSIVVLVAVCVGRRNRRCFVGARGSE